MPYCPYTDTEWEAPDMNSEHIVPLSLGGLNGFQTLSNKDFNSSVGSKTEGEIASDVLFMMVRRAADARGHSGKPPVPVLEELLS